MAKKEMPEVDELVIIKIKKIMPYGAFCELEEYDGKEVFMHVSEVASRWIKNIHNFLKEGQREVARVYRIVPEKHMIDVSLKRVTEADKRRKFDVARRGKRAEKLFELVAERVKKPKMKLSDVLDEIRKEYEDIFGLLEDAAAQGEEAFKNINITDEWKSAIIEVAQSSIKQRKKEISGMLTVKCPKPNGIEVIKKSLTAAISDDVKIVYIGAPHYMITVEGDNFKTCEKKLERAIEGMKKEIEKSGGAFAFERKEE